VAGPSEPRGGAADSTLRLLVAAVVAGLLAAYAALGFRLAADRIALVLFGAGEEELIAGAVSAWRLWLVPTLGGLVLGLLAWRLPGPQPQGVAEVMLAAARDRGRMALAPGIAAAFLSASAIGVGASVGREGPVVHLGATLAAALARRLRLSARAARVLLAAGAAAAIAAAFDAPFAGVFFALEVVLGSYGLAAFSPVVMGALSGTLVNRIHDLDPPAFLLPPAIPSTPLELPAFLLLAVVSAGAAMTLLWGVRRLRDLHRRLGAPPALQPALAGAAVGALALAYPEVLGVGYEVTSRALEGGFTLSLYLQLAAAKLAATVLCLASRFGGGVVSPSLAIGALVGGGFGVFAAELLPGLASGPRVYAVLGMGAVAAAVLGAPISTATLIFEMTGSTALAFALMAVAAIATLITQKAYGHSFFTEQLACRGIDILRERSRAPLRALRVADLMRRDCPCVGAERPLGELAGAPARPVYVVDRSGRLVGVLHPELLWRARAGGLPAESRAAQVMAPCPARLVADADLADALARFTSQGALRLPVVRGPEDLQLVGELHLGDLIRALEEDVMRAHAG